MSNKNAPWLTPFRITVRISPLIKRKQPSPCLYSHFVEIIARKPYCESTVVVGMYMPNKSDWSNWNVSPNLAPSDLLAKSPKTGVEMAELDIPCEEGPRYGDELRQL